MDADAEGTRHRVQVTPGAEGCRLDRMLADALPALSRSRLKALIADGRVRRTGPPDGAPDGYSDGGETIDEPSYRVKRGQSFTVSVPQPVPARPRPQAIALDVVYEDDDLLVIDKPAGLVVHPAPGNPDGTLVNALIAHCGEGLSGIGGERRPGIVHRLDKDTSGLMVVAKNDLAHRHLSAQFKARTVARAYRALLWGVPRPARAAIEGNIGRNPRNRKKMAVVARGGKPALTRYRVLRPLGAGAAGTAVAAASLVECRLATGRTHQIRVHLAQAGHPVIGDRFYGGLPTAARRRAVGAAAADAIQKLNRQALHAVTIGFRHPRSAEQLEFFRDFPGELKELTDLLDRPLAD